MSLELYTFIFIISELKLKANQSLFVVRILSSRSCNSRATLRERRFVDMSKIISVYEKIIKKNNKQ